METLNRVLMPEAGVAIVVLAVLLVLMAILLGREIHRGRALRARLDQMTRGATDGSFEGALNHHIDAVRTIQGDMAQLETAVSVLQAGLPLCLQRCGMVRYNAFDDVGGEQSFSVALLNAVGDGVILSSVRSRNSVQVYAKACANGKPSHTLSHEEELALERSRT
ncbi:MAG: DUF4446 family protein [Armatimonadetes bacterium]|nr:DUF4446 family protein [Armatimonadota bacterium]MDE2207715.1 DUF4446 family protein [Armatimonadota bacterium]